MEKHWAVKTLLLELLKMYIEKNTWGGDPQKCQTNKDLYKPFKDSD